MAVGTTGVSVGATGVAVGGTAVGIGGTDVAVGRPVVGIEWTKLSECEPSQPVSYTHLTLPTNREV